MISKPVKSQTFIFLLAGIVLTSCHAHKFSAGRTYRNLTAYYNGYFNAKEIYKQDLKKIDLVNPDHYDRVLTLYKLGDEASAAGLASDMDKIITKTSTLIKRHDRSDWVDDSYLLMGKAYYLKGNYVQALDNFQFIYNSLPDPVMKEAGLIWATRAFMKQEKKNDAQVSLDLALGADLKSKKKNNDELYSTAAQFYLEEKDTTKAMDYLLTGAKGSKVVPNKIRYYFILAQLSELRRNQAQAIAYYHKVQQLHPGYDLEFGTKLGLANSSGSSREVDAELENLLKDEKNADYLDQIYYTQGNIALQNKHIDEAIKLYNTSLNHNTGNANQKGLAYERLGEIYLNSKKDYKKASAYYDSTLTFLDKSYPNYTALQKMQQNLGALTQNYTFIDQEDTLLMLADLDQKTRTDKIHRIIAEQIAKQKAIERAAVEAYKAKLAASNARFAVANGVQTGNGINANTQQNSFLQTSGGTSAGGLSSYTPSAANQMQIYAQGANTSLTGASQYSTSTAGFGATSSSANAFTAGANGTTSAFGAAGGLSQGTATSSTFGSTSGFGTGAGGYGGATPVYGASNTTNAVSQGLQGQSYGQGAGTTPAGGAALYGGTSFSTIGGGGQANGVNAGTGTSMSNSSPYNQNLQSNQIQGNDIGNTTNTNTTNTPFSNTSNGTPSSFVPNTAPVNNTGLLATSQNNGQTTYTNPAYASQQQGAYQNQGNNQNQGAYQNQGNNQNQGAYQNQGNTSSSMYNSSGAYPSNPYATNTASANPAFSSFYFANPNSMSQGYGQFIQLWGNRPLRDNWRRSSRIGDQGADVPDHFDSLAAARKPQNVLQAAAADPKKAEESLLKLVPTTTGQKDTMVTSILDAYVANANIYEADLNDYPKAIATYEEMLRRFPESKSAAQFMFNLYNLYTKIGNTQKADFYKNLIIKNYPESLYTTSFLHPEQLQPANKVDSVLEKHYDSTYQAYLNHHYDSVFALVKKIPKSGNVNYLADKFDYLNTLSLGYTQPLSVFEPALKNLASTYAATPVGKEASGYLKAIDSNRAELSSRKFALEGYAQENGFELAEQAEARKEAALKAEKARIAEARRKFYAPDLSASYQMLILFNGAHLNMTTVRLGLSQFAAANFGNQKLNNVLTRAPDGKPAMMVGTFTQFKTAIAYYKKFSEDKENVIPLNTNQYEFYIISNGNLQKMSDTAKLQIYREFFDAVYAPYASANPPELPSSSTAGVTPAKKTSTSTVPVASFTLDEHSPYVLVLAVNSVHVNLNPVRLQISIFDRANFPDAKLQHQTRILNNEAQLISVTTFPDLAAANLYFKKFVAAKNDITGLAPEQYQIVLMSIANYNKLHTLSDLDAYKHFFDKQFKPK